MGTSASKLPAGGKMRRLVLTAPNADMTQAKLTVETVDIPLPKNGEVLIKVIAAPVNPSDYGEWKKGGEAPKEAVPIGKEGSGIVIASGGGLAAVNMVGKKVGFCNLPRGQGTFSEYVTASALLSVYPMPNAVQVEDACSFFVNPYTAYGLYDTAVSRGSPGMVHTAAASQLGQMLVKFVKAKPGFALINVVRRQEQADMLTALGAEHVVVTDKEGWEDELRALVKKTKVTVCMDAIAGEMSGKLLDVLPPKGTVFVYGGLSGQSVSSIHPLDLIYREKKIEGWLLPRWLKAGGNINLLMRIRSAGSAVNGGLEKPDGWSRSQFVDTDLDNMWTAFTDLWNSGFTNKKLRIRFHTEESTAEAKEEAEEEAN